MLKIKNKKNSKILVFRSRKAIKRNHKESWNKFLELGEKLNRLWKVKKTFLEILKEERIK